MQSQLDSMEKQIWNEEELKDLIVYAKEMQSHNEELRAIYLTNVQDVFINTGFCGADYDIPSSVETDKQISLYITGLPIDQKALSNLQVEIPEDLTGQYAPQHGACIEVLRVSNLF